MKQEYDFSKGERGTFYSPEAESSFPIYLDSDIVEFITETSTKDNVDISKIANTWLRLFINQIKPLIGNTNTKNL